MKTKTRLSVGLAGVLCVNLLLPLANAWAGDLAVDNLTVGTPTTGGNATGVLPTLGTRYVLVEQLQGDNDAQRGQKLLNAYAKAKTMSPGANNRITVLVPPGDYDLGTGGITLDTSYIDLIGLVPARMTKHVTGAANMWDPAIREYVTAMDPPVCALYIYGSGQGVIKQTAGYVRIANLIVANTQTSNPHNNDSSDPAAYFPDSALPGVVVEHVYFGGAGAEYRGNSTAWSMRFGTEYAGVYKDCVAGVGAFGCNANASGSYEDCVGEEFSFGAYYYASGTFVYCTARSGSFGAIASGSFRSCIGEQTSFGFFLASGYFERCMAGSMSFGEWSGWTSSTVLVHCACKNSTDYNYNSAPINLEVKITPMGDLSMGTFTQ